MESLKINGVDTTGKGKSKVQLIRTGDRLVLDKSGRFIGRTLLGARVADLLFLLPSAGRLTGLLCRRIIAGVALGGVAMQLLQLASRSVVDCAGRSDSVPGLCGKFFVINLRCVILA